ncbi:unnamed protein product [Cuscuta epithymum]|uniref:F-box associated domain-containing protein n=1 Tax=Cuscuta epithymum TaxID=186058 RepID=A0AAV0EPX6_9ASTE|nr:unnamed protein product [Cuscuta epithymum]
MPKMNQGKGIAIVQEFGSRIFVLQINPALQDRLSGSVFEVFDSAFPESGLVAKSATPFSEGRYIVHEYHRIGEKLYLQVSCQGKRRLLVFDFKTEEWSKDHCFFVWKHRCHGCPVPGLDEDMYLVFGFLIVDFPEIRAGIFPQGKGFSCYQNVNGIFHLEGFGGDKMGCTFVEIGNRDYHWRIQEGIGGGKFSEVHPTKRV